MGWGFAWGSERGPMVGLGSRVDVDEIRSPPAEGEEGGGGWVEEDPLSL